MKPTPDQLGELLAQRRNIAPGDEYWQNFLCEFHENQRRQALRRPAYSEVVDRFSRWISDLGITRLAYGLGLAYAGFTAAYLLTPPSVGEERMAPSPASYQVVPAAHQAPLPQVDESGEPIEADRISEPSGF